MKETETIGAMLRQWRQCYGMTLADMATRCRCSVSALSEYETGRARVPYHIIVGVPAALGVSPHAFLLTAAMQYGVIHVPAGAAERDVMAAINALGEHV